MTVIRFPTWLVERRGEVVQGPSAKVIVLPVVRVERAICKSDEKYSDPIQPGKSRRKRRAKR